MRLVSYVRLLWMESVAQADNYYFAAGLLVDPLYFDPAFLVTPRVRCLFQGKAYLNGQLNLKALTTVYNIHMMKETNFSAIVG
jgi:hypothetical protein